jgi:hypothetical protein
MFLIHLIVSECIVIPIHLKIKILKTNSYVHVYDHVQEIENVEISSDSVEKRDIKRTSCIGVVYRLWTNWVDFGNLNLSELSSFALKILC